MDDVEKCIEYLGHTAEEIARWKSAEKFYMYNLKHIEAKAYLTSEAKTIEAKKQEARASEEFVEALDKYKDSVYHAEMLESKREAARLKISLYQSRLKAGMENF